MRVPGSPPSRRNIHREMMREEFPVYMDRPLRDLYGPPPGRGPEKGPLLRGKKGLALSGSGFKGSF